MPTLRAIALAATLLLPASAHAAIFRAYLAADGNDANPCTLPQPCRLLPAALSVVADGGEIWMLDSANYNTATVNIAKSVSILAVPGVVGSVLAIGGPAISITTPALIVALRNVVIAPLPGGGGTDGISMTAASRLNVESSLVTNLAASGLYAAGSGTTVRVVDSVFRNNIGFAIFLENGSTAEVTHTKMLGNHGGVHAKATTAISTRASVSDCTIAGGYFGVYTFTNLAGATAAISIMRSTIGTTLYALAAETTGGGISKVLAGSNLVNGNQMAYFQNGGGSFIFSYETNQMDDNASSVGTLSPAGLL